MSRHRPAKARSHGCWRYVASAFSMLLFISACSNTPPAANGAAQLVIYNATVYPQPGAKALTEHTLIIEGGVIRALRPSTTDDASIRSTHRIDGTGLVVSAGFRNAHVHLTSPTLSTQPQRVLNDMLLQQGFTHIVDTGSDLAQSLKLRSAIESGTLKGPHITLANGSFVYTNGTPSYLPGITLPEVDNVAAAGPMVRQVLNAGADGIKLFSGSFITPENTIYLPIEVIAAITNAAHQNGAFVMAHPTTIRGLTNAVQGGVDILAHTTPPESDVPQQLLEQMVRKQTAVIPTLKLWRYELTKFGAPPAQASAMEAAAVKQLGLLHRAGVDIIFGTDVGYMTEFDTGPEFRLMARAGMTWTAVHAALTTNPAKRFAKTEHDLSWARGTLAEGAPADLTLIGGDPASDIEALSDVRYTVISGEPVFAKN